MNTCATCDEEGETVVGGKIFLHKWKLEMGISSEDLCISLLESYMEGEK